MEEEASIEHLTPWSVTEGLRNAPVEHY